uniref:Uncharacterized protein n=1 Tax=Calcidiscus leptoporus TaxID=127549 RepID=A0A7S0JGK4_9EUKA|mmetsp:Transcript_57403/g.131772  ORF Transcript_57403/g.131772 Transcript_57403/m.131772 type:complete len:188 (+) Transcript_57403:121-684(+)
MVAVKKWKENVTVVDLAGACTFNAMFFTFALMDYSADLWVHGSDARMPFLVEYFTWRGDAPVISKMLMVLLLPLPLIIIGMALAALQSIFCWRHASLTRHAVDCAEAAGICSILYVVIMRAIPLQSTFVESCPGRSKQQKSDCSATLAVMTEVHLILVLLNVLMFVCPIAKYAFGNVASAKTPEKSK